ncbi:substrate-binding domain-containing protein [Thalassospira sp. MA62]|nr:substrate-binding domain-containing protein [Thalassospira sp. MA62]
MTKRVKLLDVARAAGVSQGTASNAFGKPDLVRAEVRERIFAAARELGYRGPHVMARMLRTGRAGALGVVFPDNLEYAFSDPVAIELLRGIARACAHHGVNVMVISAENPQQAIAAVNNAAVDGFLVHCFSDQNEIIAAILRRHQPLIGIDTDIAGAAGTVALDDFAAAHLAATHLRDCGARKFAILSLQSREDEQFGPMSDQRIASVSHRVVRERLAGYHAALAAAGVTADDIIHIECDNQSPHARQMTADLLSAHPDIDGILAMSDVIAIGALDAARDLGRKVPDDLKVIGIDGITDGERTDPPLTTVRQDTVEKGRRAAELVLAMNGEDQTSDNDPAAVAIAANVPVPDPGAAQNPAAPAKLGHAAAVGAAAQEMATQQTGGLNLDPKPIRNPDLQPDLKPDHKPETELDPKPDLEPRPDLEPDPKPGPQGSSNSLHTSIQDQGSQVIILDTDLLVRGSTVFGPR